MPFAYSPPDSGIMVFSDDDGEAWGTDGVRIVRLSVPAATAALGSDATTLVAAADRVRALIRAGMGAERMRRVPKFLFPKGVRRGGWPDPSQAERTRVLTELPGVSVEVLDLETLGLQRGSMARIRRSDGLVIAFVMAQRRR